MNDHELRFTRLESGEWKVRVRIFPPPGRSSVEYTSVFWSYEAARDWGRNVVDSS